MLELTAIGLLSVVSLRLTYLIGEMSRSQKELSEQMKQQLGYFEEYR